MAYCDSLGIYADILNDCTKPPIGGVEEVVILFNRKDIATVTYGATPSLVEDIVLKVGKKAYQHKAFKKSSNGGHELSVLEDMPDHYKQKFSLVAWGIDTATIEALDNLSDIVAVVEMKNKGAAGDGAYQIFGLQTGLYKSTDARTFNDKMGNRSIELSNLAGEESTVSSHVFFKTDYATTKALVDSLLVTQA